LFGGEIPPNKRVSNSKKNKAHDSTTATRRINPDPEGTEFLLQLPSPDWSRRKTSLSDLCGAAVKPAAIGIYTF
jgi:hypothetical protein